MTSLSDAIRAALLTPGPREKVVATRKLVRDWRRGDLAWSGGTSMPDSPSWPQGLELLPPNRMPKRGKGGSRRNAIALWHSLAHIEFVAIDLALDTAGRFAGEMGREFVDDFLSVAADEAMHFALIDRHLRTLESSYGQLPAHDGLWQAAHETRHDVAARLAVVPMVLEARGLDVTPGMILKLRQRGDDATADILDVILREEVGHVAAGSRWFRWYCAQRGLEPRSTFKALLAEYARAVLYGPFNRQARLEAGFDAEELASLETLAG